MHDAGGCGQQLVMRQVIYFRDHREHSPEYTDVYPDIQAHLLRFIMPNSSRTRHISYPTRNAAFTAGCLVAAGTPAAHDYHRAPRGLPRDPRPGRSATPAPRPPRRAPLPRHRPAEVTARRAPTAAHPPAADSRTSEMGLNCGKLNKGLYWGILTRSRPGRG
jgi:hypothetical protein